jgi:hypothetical protein
VANSQYRNAVASGPLQITLNMRITEETRRYRASVLTVRHDIDIKSQKKRFPFQGSAQGNQTDLKIYLRRDGAAAVAGKRTS